MSRNVPRRLQAPTRAGRDPDPAGLLHDEDRAVRSPRRRHQHGPAVAGQDGRQRHTARGRSRGHDQRRPEQRHPDGGDDRSGDTGQQGTHADSSTGGDDAAHLSQRARGAHTGPPSTYGGRDGPDHASERWPGHDARYGSGRGRWPSLQQPLCARPAARRSRHRRAGARAARPARHRSPAQTRSSICRSSSSNGSPRQPQRTVRSLGAVEKQMPWSQPWTSSPVTSRWPPLRSALLTRTSNTAMRRSRSSRVRIMRRMSASSSASIQSWTMPLPAGPSRTSVGGTIDQPVTSETCHAASSRSGERARPGSRPAAARPRMGL